ncbi:hypothetical protein DUGA6_56540 [Duganella sp. HH105]|nr:hypothetical protein DUGA6_56540 [Duganella sp. HH105]
MRRHSTHRCVSSVILGHRTFGKCLLLVATCLWRLIWLPPHAVGVLWRYSIAIGMGAIRWACLALFGIIGLSLVGSLCFGVGSVLLYPLWH